MAITSINNTLSRRGCKAVRENYVRLETAVKKEYDTFSIEKAAKASVKDENFLGRGGFGVVYLMEGLKDFVVKVKCDLDLSKMGDLKIKPVKDFSPGFNYGQAVAADERGVEILKRVHAQEHSYPEYVRVLRNAKKGLPINPEEAINNLEQLEHVARFPLKSYIDLAKKVKFLNHTHKTIDAINPNNLMVNDEKKQFFLIDLFEKNKMKEKGKVGVDHMIALLLDNQLHLKTFEALPVERRDDYLRYSQLIIAKCKQAGRATGLGRSTESVRGVFVEKANDFYQRRGQRLLLAEEYQKFVDFYPTLG